MRGSSKRLSPLIPTFSLGGEGKSGRDLDQGIGRIVHFLAVIMQLLDVSISNEFISFNTALFSSQTARS